MSQVALYKPLDFYDFYGDDIGCVPFGLMALFSSLRRKGISSVIVDARIDKIDHNINDISLLGITCIAKTDMFDAWEVARRVKKSCGAPVIFGGFYPTFNPVEVLSNENVDMVCIGMGEEVIVEVMEALSGKRDLSSIDGLVYRKGKEIIFNRRRKCLSLVNFPSMDYSGVDFEKYVRPFPLDDSRGAAYFSSRGCPYSCSFCSVRTFYGGVYLSYPVDKVIEDLERYVRNYRIDGIYFWDDNFFVDKDRVLRICRLLIEKKLNIEWGALARSCSINQYDDEEWEIVMRSGCVYLNVGMQSGSDRMLKIYNRGETVDDYGLTIDRCRKSGIILLADFIIGHPEETKKDVSLTLDLIDQLMIVDNFHVIMYNYMFYSSVPETVEKFEVPRMDITDNSFVINLITVLLSVDRLSHGTFNASIFLQRILRSPPVPSLDIDLIGISARQVILSLLRFSRNFFMRIVIYLAICDAKWRWKKRFFDWAFEFQILLLLRKIYRLSHSYLWKGNVFTIVRKIKYFCQIGI